MPDAMLFALLSVLGLAVASFVHEGGHLTAGALLRCDPRVICIGTGRTLGRVRCAGLWILVRLLPVGGYVLLLPRSRERRVASFLLTAAGPSANLAAAAVLWCIPDVTAEPAALTCLVAQLFLAAVTLLPRRIRISGAVLPSDGMKMLVFLLGRDRDVIADLYKDLEASWIGDDGPPARTSGFAEVVFQASRLDRAEPWGRRQAIDALAALIAGGALNAMEAAYAAHLINGYVDAEQAAFRQERQAKQDSRRRSWRRAAATVASAMLRTGWSRSPLP